MNRTRTIAISLAIVLLGAGVAFAAEGGGGGDHGLPWANFGFRVLNLVIVVGIIWKFGGKAIRDLFLGRRDKIKSELDDLETRRKDAEGKLRDVEQSIASIEQEKEDILSESRRQGEALKQAIIEEAERKAEQIRTSAEASVAAERRMVLQDLRAEVADMVVEAAESMLKEKLTEEDHRKLVDDYLKKVVLN
ncbi:F0F1 ATP synthase subunit B [Desulfohalovibrio reitneri]|uniref:F0F1 ATP synthase subunit B n=1 Tax=Desulfohalovibrio reitneri TaxID=1307759 RepID=UPI0004A740DD|nr:F0F1 ATP synthase subunit B [Desulfohalovibrio reitneri]